MHELERLAAAAAILVRRSLLVILASVRLATSAATPVMRPGNEPFGRAECEAFILGPAGLAKRAERLRWLIANAPLALEAHVGPLPNLTYAEADPYFAVYRAEDATAEEHVRLMNEASARTQQYLAANTDRPSTPLSALQAAALGVSTPSATPADHLVTMLTSRDGGRLALETFEDGRRVGEVEFAVDDVRLGYRGDPSYWLFYEAQKDRASRRELTAKNFVGDRGILVFRASSHDRPIVYAVQTIEPEFTDRNQPILIHVEIYAWRRVAPRVVEEAPVQIPPLRGPDALATRVTSVGLRLIGPMIDAATGVEVR